ncbi:hypothetical protein [Halorussus caseinilyticus]|uniref:Calcium-binding protein n=1 Tax=Halorussus caseinilyticus TaxID=3034025 RepID=A0ABD5WIX8_9EURY
MNTTPGARGTFETNVTLSRQVNRITVSATDPNRRWSPDYGGDNRTVGRDVLRLDADWLPDYYEVSVTGTDPLGRDSNATTTPTNESGNGRIDGGEDLDGDGLRTEFEFTIGTDPLDGDTDDDRLTDSFEVNATETDPLGRDSNSTATNATERGNNVTDAQEDLDNDGLVNVREQAFGTNPLVNDTDRDGLFDGYEVQTTGTDPANPDSDSTRTTPDEAGNGLADGREDFDNDTLNTAFEQYSGLDPFSEDTDGDGLTDSFEVGFADLDPNATDADGDGVTDPEEDLDGDGLSNIDEQAVGTLPLVADTDTDNLTDGTEFDLGTDPLAADTDADNLTDSEEYNLGTDPLAADTDADGLGDSVEVGYDSLDATVADTDGDGLEDGADDLDGDGLTNRREAASKTKLAVNDTEGDGLEDGRERALGTNPLVADTDGDGLADSAEVDVGADPLVADTDGDGTLDGNETYTTEKKDGETGVTLSVTGDGNAASNTSVEHKPAYHDGTAASAGPTVRIDSANESAVEATNVTVPVNSDATDAEAEDLTVYVWNGSTNQAWHPVDTYIDLGDGTASASVESGTYVTVLNRTAWNESISVEKKAPASSTIRRSTASGPVTARATASLSAREPTRPQSRSPRRTRPKLKPSRRPPTTRPRT